MGDVLYGNVLYGKRYLSRISFPVWFPLDDVRAGFLFIWLTLWNNLCDTIHPSCVEQVM